MTKDLEEAIKNADRDTLIEELFRGYSFAIPAIGACHPYNEIKAGKTSPALEHMKKNRPECYKVICDLVEKDKAAEAAASHPKVCIHHVKVGDRYVVKNELHVVGAQMTFSVENVFIVAEMRTGSETKIIFEVEHLGDELVPMSYANFCVLVENGSLVKQEK